MSRARVCLCVLTLLLLATLARAWVPLAGDVWPDGTVTLSYVTTSAAPGGGNWDSALREAATIWNRSLQRIQLNVGPATSNPGSGNGRSEVYFDRTLNGEPFPSGVLAATGNFYTRGVHTESDIAFNASYTWSVFAGSMRTSPIDFRRVAVHELGHSLGLDHPDEYGQSVSAIMNSHAGDTETPTTDDQGGVHALYDFNPGPPVIRRHPTDTTARQGTSATLTVSAGGRGPLAYEWRRNGTPVSGGTTSSFKFTTTLDDAGDYTVAVSNSGGSVTSQAARLTIFPAAAPRILSVFPSSGFLITGMDVTLSSSFSGDSPLTFVWRHNGVVIPGATSSTLILRDVQLSDAGDYTLTATNIAGQATSTPTHLVIPPAQPPRILRDLPAAAVVAPGGRLELSVTALASPPLRFQWQRNGVDLPGATEQFFVVSSFKAGDQGAYTVTVSNPLGGVASRPADVTLYDVGGYAIARQPAAVSNYVDADVSFEVGMQHPATTWTWFKNGLPLPNPPGRSAPTSQLTLNHITAADEGIYSVEVSDGVNRARSSGARLTVLATPLPLIMEQPATNTVVTGTGVLLNVQTRQAANIQWYKDGVPVSTSIPFFFSATAATAGRYFARVTTSTETADTEVAEVVIVPVAGRFGAHPTSRTFDMSGGGPEVLRLLKATDDSARLRAQQVGTLYVYRRGGVEVASPYSTRENGTYTLTLGPANAPETSRPFTLSFVTVAPVITRHPAGAGVVIGDPMTLTVEFRGQVSDLRFQWFKDGVPLPARTQPSFLISAFSAADVGSYTVSVQNSQGTTVSEPAVLELRGLQPLITVQPPDVTLVEGESSSLSVGLRNNDLRVQWQKNGAPIFAATNRSLNLRGSVDDAGNYTATVTSGATTVTSRPARVQILAAKRIPAVLVPPVGGTGVLGGTFELFVGADGGPLPDGYQWRRNGVDIPGANDAKLKLSNLQPGDAGVYTVLVLNANGSTVSPAATLTIDDRARLINLATRATVGTGGNVLVAGFVLSGTQSRSLLVRAIGEQLIDFGVAGAMRDPVLTIFDSKAKQLATNDDWFRTGEDEMTRLENAARQVGAFAQNRDAHDSALIVDLAPGAYSAQVSGFSNATGVALVEVYEMGAPSNNRLINLSTRAMVGQGANVLIPGMVLSGRSARTILVRAIGPALADFGVAGTLSDPKLIIYRGGEKVVENDNWSEQSSAPALASAMQAVGAFPLKTGTRDAAVLLDLPPGPYTIQVAGVGDTSGIALVEVYEVASP